MDEQTLKDAFIKWIECDLKDENEIYVNQLLNVINGTTWSELKQMNRNSWVCFYGDGMGEKVYEYLHRKQSKCMNTGIENKVS